MSKIAFGEGGCEKTRRYLDSYVSSELSIETTHEMVRHLSGCPMCAAEVDARSRLRSRLRVAFKAQPVPPQSAARMRELLRASESRNWFGMFWPLCALAVSAAILVAAAGWFPLSHYVTLPALANRKAQDVFIKQVADHLSVVMRVGLRDHVHCSIFRKYPDHPPPAVEMEKQLGADYAGLLPIVKVAVPEGYRIIMAHQCGYQGRKYIHVTLSNGDHLISLVISKKYPGEAMSGLHPAVEPSGVSVYQYPAERYEVAGFETDRFLAFVVSDLGGQTNLQMAVNMAPGVHAFLAHLPA
jgi:hypothetical protein